MKYFTFELWQQLQGRKYRAAQRVWDARAAEYMKIFDRLSTRLGKRTVTFLRNCGFHDGRVVGIKDDGTRAFSLLVEKEGRVYIARFKNVRKVNFDFARPGGVDSSSLLEWGYEEFSHAGRDLLQINVLFSSGASLMVQFQKLQVVGALITRSQAQGTVTRAHRDSRRRVRSRAPR